MVMLVYMELIICCFIAIREVNYWELMKNAETLDKISYIASYVTLFFLYLFPLSIILILIKHKGTLNEDSFKAKYAPLILDLKTSSIQEASFHAIYMMRRAVVTFSFVYLNELPLLAINIHLLSTTVYIIYIIKT